MAYFYYSGYLDRMSRYDRIYIEITNQCNLSCSFCPGTTRNTQIMPVDDFKRILAQCTHLTKEIFLHVLGEPVQHPAFEQIIILCQKTAIPVQITSNGTLLSDCLFNPIIRQINFSLQGLEDNFPEQELEHLLIPILTFSNTLRQKNPDLYINFRLWNCDLDDNQEMLNIIEHFFSTKINRKIEIGAIKSKKIADHLYLHFDNRFIWPALSNDFISYHGHCHGLGSQLAILVDGTVVPCCLDKDGIINLGNCLETPLNEILDSKLAQQIAEGFKLKQLVHPLCQRCSYARRFSKKVNS